MSAKQPWPSRKQRGRIVAGHPDPTPPPHFSRFCLCGGCCPGTTIKGTGVCFNCRYTARVTLMTAMSMRDRETDPRLRSLWGGKREALCPHCRRHLVVFRPNVSIPSPKHESAWRRFARRHGPARAV
jgi:hypothetical protein